MSRSDLFLWALKEKPSMELRKGHYWHIGNISIVDEYGGYFAAGRTTKSILEKYDQHSGDFLEEMLETSPYTYVLFDCRIGLLAIAKKSKLSPTVSGISKKIQSLFESSAVIAKHGITVTVDPISDPLDFIASLRSSFNIKTFEVTFSRPNPFDADEYFQKPMEKYLDAANGDQGKTSIAGDDLDSVTLVEVTKSVAATGNDAKAVLRVHSKAAYSIKRLRSNPAHFSHDDERYTLKDALLASRDNYRSVRDSYDVLEDNTDQ